MPKTEEVRPTLEELTVEQKENTDREYVAAVNARLEKAIAEADAGQLISHQDVWIDLDAYAD